MGGGQDAWKAPSGCGCGCTQWPAARPVHVPARVQVRSRLWGRPTLARSPSGPAVLLLPFNPQHARAGRGADAGPQLGHHYTVFCGAGWTHPVEEGRGQPWGRTPDSPYNPGSPSFSVCPVPCKIWIMQRLCCFKNRSKTIDPALAFTAQ